MALFGKTAAQWRQENPELKGNMRDYATVEQLLVLSNLESTNAIFIEQGASQQERLIKLNKIAIAQIKALTETKSVKQLKSLDEKKMLK